MFNKVFLISTAKPSGSGKENIGFPSKLIGIFVVNALFLVTVTSGLRRTDWVYIGISNKNLYVLKVYRII